MDSEGRVYVKRDTHGYDGAGHSEGKEDVAGNGGVGDVGEDMGFDECSCSVAESREGK